MFLYVWSPHHTFAIVLQIKFFMHGWSLWLFISTILLVSLTLYNPVQNFSFILFSPISLPLRKFPSLTAMLIHTCTLSAKSCQCLILINDLIVPYSGGFLEGLHLFFHQIWHKSNCEECEEVYLIIKKIIYKNFN